VTRLARRRLSTHAIAGRIRPASHLVTRARGAAMNRQTV
jgi:hypothetical protein